LGARRPSARFADVLFMLIMVCVILAVLRNYMVSGEIVKDYLMAGDGMGHAYKVEMVKRMLLNDRVLVDWDDGWYCGYHPFHFYSPLGYAPYVVLNIVLNDLGGALRVGLALGFIAAAVGMYFLVLTLLHDRAGQPYAKLAAAGAGLFYSLNPHITYFVAVAGELASLYSIAMMPVSFLFLFKLLRAKSFRMSVGYALATATVFLTHAHFGFLVFTGGFLLFMSTTVRDILLSIHVAEGGFSMDRLRKREILRTTVAYVASVMLFAGLVAFWMIPFFLEVSDLAKVMWPEVPYFSVGYLDVVERSVAVVSRGRYLGAIPVVAMIFAFLDRKNWRELGPFIFSFFIMWLLALGSNTPIYALLPFEKLLPPERALSVLALITACVLPYSFLGIKKGVDEALRLGKSHRFTRHGLAYAFGVLLIVLVMFDISIGFRGFSLLKGNADFIDLSNQIRSLDRELEGARMMFVEPSRSWPTYVLYPFSPILADRPYASGYYEEGSKASYAVFYSSTVAVEKNETKYFMGRFVDYDIRYVVVMVEDNLTLNKLLQTGQFRLVDTVGRYNLLEFLGRKGFIIESRPDILVIGADDYSVEVARGVLSSFSQNFTVTRGQYNFVDDYSLSDLKDHDAVVIYGIKHHDMSAAEKLLSQYVKDDGFLMIDADGSADLSGRFMGVNYYHFTPSAASTIAYSKFNFTSGLNPSGWTGVVYEGLDDPLLITSEDKTIVGRKNDVVFLGGNLFYHTAVTFEPAQISLLEQLTVSELETDGGRRVDYEVIEKRADHKEYKIRLDSDAMVRLSITTSPYWKVYVDGVPSKIIDQDGFVRLFVRAGEHTITFQYTDTTIKIASNVITGVSLMLCALIYLRFGKGKRQTNTIPARSFQSRYNPAATMNQPER